MAWREYRAIRLPAQLRWGHNPLAQCVEQFLANPGTPLRELDILGDKERQRLLCEWNNTPAAVPDISVPRLVEQWAAATPEAPAVVFRASRSAIANCMSAAC